jgi:polyisoprenoid-binding protein YceI
LTLHGITRPVPLAITRTTFGPQRVRFSATAQLKRGEFGIDRWSGGGAVVSDKVAVRLEIDAVRQT